MDAVSLELNKTSSVIFSISIAFNTASIGLDSIIKFQDLFKKSSQILSSILPDTYSIGVFSILSIISSTALVKYSLSVTLALVNFRSSILSDFAFIKV